MEVKQGFPSTRDVSAGNELAAGQEERVAVNAAWPFVIVRSAAFVEMEQENNLANIQRV